MVNVKKPHVQAQRPKPAQMVGRAMRAHFLVLRTQGRTAAARTAEEFYGFRARDVIEMHFEKRGPGRGLWFRLKDGRVVKAVGKSARRARSFHPVSKSAAPNQWAKTREPRIPSSSGMNYKAPLSTARPGLTAEGIGTCHFTRSGLRCRRAGERHAGNV